MPGNAYPYGGGSVGRYDFACFSSVACKVVTGRFTDYDDILDRIGLEDHELDRGDTASTVEFAGRSSRARSRSRHWPRSRCTRG